MDKIYFLRPGTDTHKIVLRKILSIINNSKQLLFCVSYFTHMGIADAIIERVKSKKETYMILNTHDILRPQGQKSTVINVSAALLKIFTNVGHAYEGEDGEYHYIGHSDEYDNPLKVKLVGRDSSLDSLQSIMHEKFIVGDRKIVAFGSLNYTHNAFKNNYENVCFSKDIILVDTFRNEFSDLWKHGDTFFTEKGKIRSVLCPMCRKEGGIDFDSYGASCTYCSHKFRKTDYG